ncbi:MAG: hypothetical protein GY714_23710 [Desulfobacterales bacterium]|nr:hypothetical protein [Desulfobacterales bacterium]MCP4162210.1 hypothetical protein [Deltaproteobacteria bacterium]
MNTNIIDTDLREEFEIQDIIQLSENILDQVRQGKRKLSEKMIDRLLQNVKAVNLSHNISLVT